MFSYVMGEARYAAACDFEIVAECFSRQEAARILGVTERRLASWRRGLARIPWAAFQLLYEHSKYGLAERDSMEHFERQMLLSQRDALERRISELEEALRNQSRLVDWRCANDPFIDPSDPRAATTLLT